MMAGRHKRRLHPSASPAADGTWRRYRGAVRRSAIVLALVVVACAAESGATFTEPAGIVSPSTSVPSTVNTTLESAPRAPRRLPIAEVEFDIAAAITINVVSGGEADPVVAWKTDGAVHVALLDMVGHSMAPPVSVHVDAAPFAHPIERPAVVIDDRGVVHVAFTAVAEGGGSVEYRTIVDGALALAATLSGEAEPETNLVQLTLSESGPVLAWLEDSTLSVAVPDGSGFVERERVDPLTCDCCDLAPVALGDRVVVAYRDLIREGSDVIRDVNVVSSTDGGESFGEPVLVADDHWFIDACPFTGPTAVDVDGALVVAWMDARQSDFPDQRASSIWVDRSTDGGATFGVDLPVRMGGINRSPRLAVDDEGVVHLVWEVQGLDGGIAYSFSRDVGESFSDPILLVDASEESGPASVPSIAVHGESLLLTWLDRSGGNFAAFDLEDLRD